ncbi:MAG TPA: hypothetical protein PKM43_18105, partial [Verrucomicrobiota bacterium]|nr:hypothetical protein [Verrucomicrobiota bacterium]
MWTTARLRLLDSLKEQQAGATNEIECIGFDEAVELYKRARGQRTRTTRQPIIHATTPAGFCRCCS